MTASAARREAAGGLAGADQSPDPLAPVKQLPDQRRADLAASPDNQGSTFSPSRRAVSLHASGLGPNLEYVRPELIKRQLLIGSIRGLDRCGVTWNYVS